MLTNYKKSGFGFLRRLITTLLIRFNFIAKPTNQPYYLIFVGLFYFPNHI